MYRFWEQLSSGPIIGAMKKSTHSPEYRMLRNTLRDLRGAAGLSQRELAVRLKVPHSWVAKVESGERRIDFVELCWFTVACGAEPRVELGNLIEQFTARPGSRRAGGHGK
jgi:transcriptional regulator with XRE-family HTH domain